LRLLVAAAVPATATPTVFKSSLKFLKIDHERSVTGDNDKEQSGRVNFQDQ